MLTAAVLVFFITILVVRLSRQKRDAEQSPQNFQEPQDQGPPFRRRRRAAALGDPATLAAFVGLLTTLAPIGRFGRRSLSYRGEPQPVLGLIAFLVLWLYVVIRKRGR